MDFPLVYLPMVPVGEGCSLFTASWDIFEVSQDACKTLQGVVFVLIYKFKPDVLFWATSGLPVLVDVSPSLAVP